MADITPNLDDGELWLPSDIFPDEVSSKENSELPCELTYMEDLAQQLAAYALLERNRTTALPLPNILPNLEVRAPVQFDSMVAPRTVVNFGVNGGLCVDHTVYAFGNGGFCVGPRPVYRYPPVKPAQVQAGGLLQARGMVLQSQENQCGNRFFPFMVNGPGVGGFVRESGGTGVFLPRAITDIKKKQSWRNLETQQRQPIKKVAVGKKEMKFQPSAQKALPKDWTN